MRRRPTRRANYKQLAAILPPPAGRRHRTAPAGMARREPSSLLTYLLHIGNKNASRPLRRPETWSLVGTRDKAMDK